MQLADFYDYKNRFAEDILTSREIITLLTADPNYDMDKAGELMYQTVYPFEYMPDTVEKAATYVFCEVEVQKTSDKTFLAPTIYIWVLSHRSLLRLPDGGVRTDKLMSEISKVLNGSRYYGLGELSLYSVRRFSPMTDYNGKVMTFHTKDFNRPHNQSAEVPANRKVWS